MDYNEFRKDTEIGASIFELAKLDEDATQENLCLSILKDGEQRGELRIDVSYFPILKHRINESGIEELPESSEFYLRCYPVVVTSITTLAGVGIVRFTIHQARDLESSGARAAGLKAYAEVFLGSSPNPIHTTPQVKHTSQPVWESTTEFLCANRSSSIITVKVIDDRDFVKDPTMGYLSVRLQDLLEARKTADRDWWQLSGCTSGGLRLTAEWKPLNIAGSLYGPDQYVPPIGAVRLWLKKATDVKSLEAPLATWRQGALKYAENRTSAHTMCAMHNPERPVRPCIGQQDRSGSYRGSEQQYVDSQRPVDVVTYLLIDLNPVWDQIIYTPVHSLKETLLLEVMDYRHLSKDRSLGTVELKVGELADEIPKGAGDSRFFFESTGRKDKSEPILGRGDQYKGQLHYAAEFLPAFTLRDLKFETVPNELQSAVEGIEDGHSDDVDDGSESTSSERRMVTRTITTTEPIGAPERYQTDLQHVDMTETQSADSLKRRNQGIQMSKDGLLAHRRW